MPLHVVVVETNEGLRGETFAAGTRSCSAPGVEVVIPGGRFRLQHVPARGVRGLRRLVRRATSWRSTTTSCCFSHGFFRTLLSGLESVESVSPFGLREERWDDVDPGEPLTVDYDHRALCGWCSCSTSGS